MIAVDQTQLARWRRRRPIPRVGHISRAEFERRFIVGDDGRGMPVIVTDAFDGWPCRRWTLDMFRERFAEVPVRCYAKTNLLSYPLQLFDALAKHPTLAAELHDRDGRPLERPASNGGAR